MTALAAALDQLSVAELRRRGSLKWTYAGPDVLGAFVAEMDFGTSPAVEAALRDVIERRDFGYLPPAAAREMAEVVAAWLARQHGWVVDPARIRPLPDVIKGLEAAITVFSRPGSPVILPTPAYMPFLTVPPQLGREIIQVPMITSGGRLTLDPDGIAAAFRAGGHLLILCNPCNPVGRVYTPAELAAVTDVVERHGGRVFADEIHAPLVYPGGRHIPYASTSSVAAGAHDYVDLGVQGLEPARSQVRPADPVQRGGRGDLGHRGLPDRARGEHTRGARQHRGVPGPRRLARGGAGLSGRQPRAAG